MMYSAPGRPRGRCFSPNESSHHARDTRAKVKASLGRRAATHLPFANLETRRVVAVRPLLPISSEFRFGGNPGATPAPTVQGKHAC
jgi:hypothetical protein